MDFSSFASFVRSPTSGGFFNWGVRRSKTFDGDRAPPPPPPPHPPPTAAGLGRDGERRTLNEGRTLNRAVTWGGGEDPQDRPMPRPLHRPERKIEAGGEDKGEGGRKEENEEV